MIKEFAPYCVIHIFSKYAWVIPLRDKKGTTITNASQKFLDESNDKPNKICVGKGSEFHGRSMKSWLEKTALEIYSTHNDKNLLLLKDLLEP